LQITDEEKTTVYETVEKIVEKIIYVDKTEIAQDQSIEMLKLRNHITALQDEIKSWKQKLDDEIKQGINMKNLWITREAQLKRETEIRTLALDDKWKEKVDNEVRRKQKDILETLEGDLDEARKEVQRLSTELRLINKENKKLKKKEKSHLQTATETEIIPEEYKTWYGNIDLFAAENSEEILTRKLKKIIFNTKPFK